MKDSGWNGASTQRLKNTDFLLGHGIALVILN